MHWWCSNWYFGPLKHRLAYVVAALRYWPPAYQAEMTYTLACDGCSRCYVPPPKPQWRWWHVFLPPRVEGFFLFSTHFDGWRFGAPVACSSWSTKLTYVEPGWYWDGWPNPGLIPSAAHLSRSVQPARSTQPGHPFVGRCNEYQPKGGDALRLGSKCRYSLCVGRR